MMRFEALYRISMDVMLVLATLALNVDMGRDNKLAPLYPVLVAVVAAVTFVTVDRRPARLVLSNNAASLLAFGSTLLCYIEYRYDRGLLVLALGHWLVYLQLIKMFRPKTVEDDWFLFVLGLTQVVIGAFQPGERVGKVLLLWALAAMWCMALFHLRREWERSTQGTPIPDEPKARIDPYPDLVDTPFLVSAMNVAALTITLGGLIFLLMPRWDSNQLRRYQTQTMSQHLTGFSESVRLGQMGAILENDTIVMSIELSNERNERVEPPPDALWRGVSLYSYARGEWTRPDTVKFEFPPGASGYLPQHHYRQVIKLEQLDTDILFGLHPVYWAYGPDLVLNRVDGSLYRFDIRPDVAYLPSMNRHPGSFTYTVLSGRNINTPEPFEFDPARSAPEPELLAVPPECRARIKRLADSTVSGLPNDPKQRAEALTTFLRDGTYRYSLQMNVIDPTIDPVEDFLFNRKQGHCEYFASALALMLRTQGIPARLVNGFKGGDWNTLGSVIYVRQKHAHSWVEALINMPDGKPQWWTFDPTPGLQRDEVVAKVGGISSRMHFATDFFRYIWVFYIAGFDAERQQRLIYGPMRALAAEAMRGFRLMGSYLLQTWRWLVDFPTAGSFLSLRGILVTVLTGMVLAAILGAAFLLLRHLIARRRARHEGDDTVSSIATYRRLLALLAELGLKRAPPETPREFSRRAALALIGRGVDLTDIPPRVVEAFYLVRFGDHTLPPDLLSEIESRLDDLEAALKPTS